MDQPNAKQLKVRFRLLKDLLTFATYINLISFKWLALHRDRLIILTISIVKNSIIKYNKHACMLQQVLPQSNGREIEKRTKKRTRVWLAPDFVACCVGGCTIIWTRQRCLFFVLTVAFICKLLIDGQKVQLLDSICENCNTLHSLWFTSMLSSVFQLLRLRKRHFTKISLLSTCYRTFLRCLVCLAHTIINVSVSR